MIIIYFYLPELGLSVLLLSYLYTAVFFNIKGQGPAHILTAVPDPVKNIKF